MCSVASISEVHAASLFRVRLTWVSIHVLFQLTLGEASGPVCCPCSLRLGASPHPSRWACLGSKPMYAWTLLILTLHMEAAFAPETSVTLPTLTQCRSPRAVTEVIAVSKRSAMMCGCTKAKLHTYLTWENWWECIVSHSGCCTPVVRATSTCWTRGWVGPRVVSLNAVAKRTILNEP